MVEYWLTCHITRRGPVATTVSLGIPEDRDLSVRLSYQLFGIY